MALIPQCKLAGIAGSTTYAAYRAVEPDKQELTPLVQIDAEYTRRLFYGIRNMAAYSNILGSGFCVDCLEQALQTCGAPEIFNTDQGC